MEDATRLDENVCESPEAVNVTDMERAATLIRVSSDSQDEENQAAEVEAHCQARRYRVTKRFRLHDMSASRGEQEAVLQDILNDIRNGMYTVLVIAHSSRIDRRDPDTQMLYVLSVRLAGGRMESVREPEFGQPTLSGRLNTVMAQHQNHEYSETLKGHLTAAKTRIKANGAFDGKPPWGYTTDGPKYNRQLVPNDLGRKYVPLIYAKVIAGVSLTNIALWLIAEGVPPMGIAKEREDGRGKTGQWWSRSVLQLVRNPVYKGHRCVKTGRTTWGKTVHRCPAIVDAGTWRKAQAALQPKYRGPAAEHRAMLAGAVFCGNSECTTEDSPMYRIHPGKQRPGAPPRTALYYRCAGRGANRKGCGTMIRLEIVDSAVNEIIAESFDTPVMARKLIPGNELELEARLEEVLSELREMDPSEMSDDEYDSELKRLRAERDEIKATTPIPDRVDLVPTGDTYAGLWGILGPSERGPWLVSQGFRVMVSKTRVTVSQGDVSASLAI